MTEEPTPDTGAEQAGGEQAPSSKEETVWRVLLTGATGFIGRRALRDLARHYHVIATHHGGLDGSPHITPVVWEATKGAPEALLALFEPAAVIHLMALSRTEACSRDPERAVLLNLEVTQRLAQAAKFRGTRFIFTSTDLVFDGRKGGYTESDPASPVSTYARTKAEAERSLAAIFQDRPDLLTIFRLGLSYGWGDGGHTGPAGWILDNLKQGKPVDLFHDEFRSPLYQGDASRAILDAIAQGRAGLFHLGGAERMDRLTLGIKLAERFGLDKSLIRSRSVRNYPGPEPRSPDCSMSSEKFAATFGWRPCGVDEGLRRMEAEAELGS